MFPSRVYVRMFGVAASDGSLRFLSWQYGGSCAIAHPAQRYVVLSAPDGAFGCRESGLTRAVLLCVCQEIKRREICK